MTIDNSLKKYPNEFNLRKNEIIAKINKAFEFSVHRDEKGEAHPFVCLSCDKFLQGHSIRTVEVEFFKRNSDVFLPTAECVISKSIHEYYTYKGKHSDEYLRSLLLSPRGICLTGKSSDRFVLCESCKSCLHRKEGVVPQYAVANGFDIGVPPKALKTLTEVELAFISEIRFHIHLISFKGSHKGIKGWHSLIKTNLLSKREALGSMDMVPYIPNKIFIIIHGTMTKEQKKIVLQKCSIRRDKCKEALRIG